MEPGSGNRSLLSEQTYNKYVHIMLYPIMQGNRESIWGGMSSTWYQKEKNVARVEVFGLLAGIRQLGHIWAHWVVYSVRDDNYLDLLQVVKLEGSYKREVEKKWNNLYIQMYILLEEQPLYHNTEHIHVKCHTDGENNWEEPTKPQQLNCIVNRLDQSYLIYSYEWYYFGSPY